ncbi:MAG: MTH938/NDUFAF3 family protein [Spirochaetes bacterium]|nr:MTH938/NDUFAF3 family protein [Spirochaetota bacterium]
MKINRLEFGSIEIDHHVYCYDLIIDQGKISKRHKKLSKEFRGKYGHTPLSLNETIPWKCKTLIIGTGHFKALPVMDDVKKTAKEKKVRLLIMSTQEAITHINEKDTNFILHITC